MAYQTSNAFFVHGRDGANKYPVGPGYTAYLFDDEEGKFYIKSNGQPLREFEYTEITPPDNSNIDMSKFATKDDFAALMTEIHKLADSIQVNRPNYRKEKGNATQ